MLPRRATATTRTTHPCLTVRVGTTFGLAEQRIESTNGASYALPTRPLYQAPLQPLFCDRRRDEISVCELTFTVAVTTPQRPLSPVPKLITCAQFHARHHPSEPPCRCCGGTGSRVRLDEHSSSRRPCDSVVEKG
jgi:hypothetical protein